MDAPRISHAKSIGFGRIESLNGPDLEKLNQKIRTTSSVAFIKRIMTHDEYTQWNKQGRPL